MWRPQTHPAKCHEPAKSRGMSNGHTYVKRSTSALCNLASFFECFSQKKMEQLARTTLVLAFCAGFADTTTYVGGHGTFSAHVTGNFILFAYELVHHGDTLSWLKLLTFPVFVIAVATGGRMAARSAAGKMPASSADGHTLLLAEALLLLATGLTHLGLTGNETYDRIGVFGPIMLTVFAMGLQNAFGKLFARVTYGPTTMMTGNVTQAALDLGKWLASRFTDKPARSALTTSGITIGGFAAGCLAGAILAAETGLTALILPAAVLLIELSMRVPAPAGQS
jgi:uncharacterized membrane protein YoaK (UPF0700 family)